MNNDQQEEELRTCEKELQTYEDELFYNKEFLKLSKDGSQDEEELRQMCNRHREDIESKYGEKIEYLNKISE